MMKSFIKYMTVAAVAMAAAISCDNKIDYSKYVYTKMETYTAVPVNDFLGSIGVNSSIASRGEVIDSTLRVMEYTGIRWIRSGFGGSQTELDNFKLLHDKLGTKFSIMCSPDETADADATDEYIFRNAIAGGKYLHSIGAFIAFEGVNEPNNWTIKYKGVETGGSMSWLGLAESHANFYKLAKAQPELAQYPIWGISEVGAEVDNVGLQFCTIPPGAGCLLPEGTTFCDALCCHNYFRHGGFAGVNDNQTWRCADPSSQCPIDGLYNNCGVTWAKGYQGYTDEQIKDIPRVTTETGTVIDNVYSEEMQALLYMSCYLAQFARGWSHTAIYILRDRVDEGGNQTFGFYGSKWVQYEPGRWTTDYQQRLAAVYMHNFTTILKDDTSIQDPGTLRYMLPSKPSTVHQMLMQKNDGTYCLVVWDERFTGGIDNVKIVFEDKWQSITVYDPTEGEDAIDILENTSEVELKMSNHPVILQFNTKA